MELIFFRNGSHNWSSTCQFKKAVQMCPLFAFWNFCMVWQIPRFLHFHLDSVGHTQVLLETLIIFLLSFLDTHLLFEYIGIWLPSLFLEESPRVKQAVGFTCKSPRGGMEAWSQPAVIYQWIICSASKPPKCVVVNADFPEGLTLRSNCL